MAIQWGNNIQPIKVYHGSDETFDEIDINKAKPTSSYSKGIYVADDEGLTNEYGKNKYEFDFTPNSVGDIENYEFSGDVIGKILGKVKKPHFGFKSNDDASMQKELEEEKAEVEGMLKKGGWLEETTENKRGLAQLRLNLLGEIAHDNGVTLKDLFKEIGVGDYDAIKIPIHPSGSGNYYVVFDPKTLKMVRKYK